ncbi:hypothetical protein NC652_035620 [Populus alba x Populus x berolinensis]|nr:hypothetical protein NC652_035620 [Populus alba x Populus x berolinensis]
MDNPVHVTRARTWDPIQGNKKEIKKRLKRERLNFGKVCQLYLRRGREFSSERCWQYPRSTVT